MKYLIKIQSDITKNLYKRFNVYIYNVGKMEFINFF